MLCRYSFWSWTSSQTGSYQCILWVCVRVTIFQTYLLSTSTSSLTDVLRTKPLLQGRLDCRVFRLSEVNLPWSGPSHREIEESISKREQCWCWGSVRSRGLDRGTFCWLKDLKKSNLVFVVGHNARTKFRKRTEQEVSLAFQTAAYKSWLRHTPIFHFHVFCTSTTESRK